MPAPTRLNARHRDVLENLARKIVDVPAEAKAEEAAFNRAESLVRAAVEAEFPPAEMKILAKYEVARRDRCINVQSDAGGVEQFVFHTRDTKLEEFEDEGADETHPLVPDRYGCRHRIYIVNAKTWNVVHAWKTARDAKRKALNEKLDKYLSFVRSATTYEQVLEIWPEASQVQDRIVSNLPSTLSTEVLAEITADSKRRMRKVA